MLFQCCQFRHQAQYYVVSCKERRELAKVRALIAQGIALVFVCVFIWSPEQEKWGHTYSGTCNSSGRGYVSRCHNTLKIQKFIHHKFDHSFLQDKSGFDSEKLQKCCFTTALYYCILIIIKFL